MQVHAIYNQGRLEFTQPISFRHQSFKVSVDIPESEILRADEVAQTKQSKTKGSTNLLQERLDAIIGKEFRRANHNKPSVNAKVLRRQHLEEKYLGN